MAVKPMTVHVPGNLLARVRSRAGGVAFKSDPESYLEFQRQEAQAEFNRQQERIHAERQQRDMRTLMERSGVQDIYLAATLDNYQIYVDGQQEAIQKCRSYLQHFGQPGAKKNMIFTGTTGTGKNHMASAICNALNASGRSAMVVTAMELQMKVRAARRHDQPLTEEQVIKRFAGVDLLVLDEIELGSIQDYDGKIVNTVIDRRVTQGKGTIILTNLILSQLGQWVGERIADRLMESFYLVETFWASYRTNKPARK